VSDPTALDRALAFVGGALAREGADLEAAGAGAIFALLPGDVATALSLPPAVTLRFAGDPAEGDTACPLEGATVQWLADRAARRGHLAGARLDVRAPSSARCGEETRRRLSLLNATIADASARPATAMTLVVELAWEARSAERTEGTVAVAVPDGGGTPSLGLADGILRGLPDARAEAVETRATLFAQARLAARPVGEAEIRRRLAPFLADCARRMAVEQERVRAYHDRLAREAGRRRGRAPAGGEASIESKRAAILRARDERLAEVAERHAVDANVREDGLLVASYPVVDVSVLIRRRRREVPVVVRWDPHLGEPVGPACGSCRQPALTAHICDDAGHLTCGSCARPCPSCGRVVCRACAPRGCRCA